MYAKGYYQVAEKLDKSAMLQTCFPHGFRICTCKDNTPMVNHSWCTRWMHIHWFHEVKRFQISVGHTPMYSICRVSHSSCLLYNTLPTIYSSKKVQVYSYMKHSGRIWSTLLLLAHTFTLSQVYYEYQNCQKLPVNQASVVRHICESNVGFYVQAWNLAGL